MARICPRCSSELTAIEVPLGGTIHLQQCQKCFGAMFDREGLERMLQWAVLRPDGFEDSLKSLLTECDQGWEQVVYLRCPDCRQQMQRRNYGGHSGVIIDVCSAHGTWMDGGELSKLFDWIKTGGTLSDCPLKNEKRRLNHEKEKLRQEAKMRNNADSADFG